MRYRDIFWLSRSICWKRYAQEVFEVDLCASVGTTLCLRCAQTPCVWLCALRILSWLQDTLWWCSPRQARSKQLCSGATNKGSESVSIMEKERKLWFRSNRKVILLWREIWVEKSDVHRDKFLHDAPNKCGDDRQRTWTQSQQICAGRNSYRMGGVSVKHTKG